VAVVGNHGAEVSARSRPARAVPRWRDALGRELAGLAGVWIEDKRFSISVHYRRSRRKATTRRAIWRAVSTLRGASVFGGHDVVNIVPRTAPDKGRALEWLRRAHRRDLVIHIGDDVTDEAAFARARATGGLAVRVGRARGSRAAYFVQSQRHIDALLRHLVHATASPALERRP
jgi:trehalose-phosphatase